MSKKYLIMAPSYDEKSGGKVVLHKLCHLLNELGYEAYIVPWFELVEITKLNFIRKVAGFSYRHLKGLFQDFVVNPSLNTPVLKSTKHLNLKDCIVVYSEIITGNPLNAPNVVRWLLHQPGYFSKKIHYGCNEIYFKFNSAIWDFQLPYSKTSDNELKVIHYPLETYYLPESSSNVRSGTAYCLRKGRHKKIVHDLNNSILIDGKTNAEIAEIFRKVEAFISYDTYTAYSIFAVLCGAKSIVVPDDGVSIEQWYPNPSDRNGIAYGMSDEELARAEATKESVFDHVVSEELKSADNVQLFVNETQEFFSGN